MEIDGVTYHDIGSMSALLSVLADTRGLGFTWMSLVSSCLYLSYVEFKESLRSLWFEIDGLRIMILGSMSALLGLLSVRADMPWLYMDVAGELCCVNFIYLKCKKYWNTLNTVKVEILALHLFSRFLRSNLAAQK